MTDPGSVREQLRRLADGDVVPPWGRDRVIERAIAATDDVAAAATFVADGGCEGLADAIHAAEREGMESRAADGREVLAAIERFQAACTADRDGPESGVDEAPATGSRSLPPRSRNH